MSNTKKEWISNWLISSIENNGNKNAKNYEIKFTNSNFNEIKPGYSNQTFTHSEIEKNLNSNDQCISSNKPETKSNYQEKKSNIKKIDKNKFKKLMIRKKNFNKIIEESELTVSPVSGTFIIKEWNNKVKNNKIITQSFLNAKERNKFTNDEIMLNSVASNYVQITDEAKYKLSKIVNCIGPYECKLCKIIYNDAFELAMHNCPRVVHYEYRCTECSKVFNCPANLASHKRWHKPKDEVIANKKSNEMIGDLSCEHQTNTDSYIDIDDVSLSKPGETEENLKFNNFYEKFPKSFEETHEIENKTSFQQIQSLVQNSAEAFSKSCITNRENQLTFTQFHNNEWLAEIYKNYLLAAVTQNYLQVKQPIASTNAAETPIFHSNNLFQHHFQQTSNGSIFNLNYNGQSHGKQESVTCKYCYIKFSDNLLLNFHIRKAHSQILLNFS